jgi:hypothetical protein
VIGQIKRWLVGQGFSERVAVLAMWQTGILLLVGTAILLQHHLGDGIAIIVVLFLLLMPTKYSLVNGLLILLCLFFILLALAAQPMLTNALR